jgi:hypothetical protein
MESYKSVKSMVQNNASGWNHNNKLVSGALKSNDCVWKSVDF